MGRVPVTFRPRGEFRRGCQKLQQDDPSVGAVVRVPWTLVRGQGQPRIEKNTRKIASIRHAAAPARNKKTLRARATSILLYGAAL